MVLSAEAHARAHGSAARFGGDRPCEGVSRKGCHQGKVPGEILRLDVWRGGGAAGQRAFSPEEGLPEPRKERSPGRAMRAYKLQMSPEQQMAFTKACSVDLADGADAMVDGVQR